MADGDAQIVLPPETRSIMGPENGPFARLGTPLPQRPPDNPLFDDADIALDIGDGIKLSISSGDEDEELAAPYIRENREPPPFAENIALKLPEGSLANIGSMLIQGVDADIMSRSSWIDQYNKGIDLLGLKIEDIAAQSTRRNVSRANEPLLLEAMVKYFAGAAAEMLPAAGPAKVSTIGKTNTAEDELAQAFEDDLNYYLTDVAKEYYPDTRRMLMHQAFCGNGFKKIYRCPIRRRPVSESVMAPDLIVSEDASDLDNALRVTHRIDMMKVQLRRMQIVGHYRDIDLGTPGTMMGLGQSPLRKIKESEGLAVMGMGRPDDIPYEMLEVDTTLDIDEYGIDGYYERRTHEGMPLPYKIAVERNSQQILGMWRLWKPEDELCLKQNMYVKFGLVTGLGFLDWGFLQLLGNQTRSLRAILRILINAGTFANFPAGIKAKHVRTGTNEIAPGPGEWVDLDVPAGADLSKLVVPLPYKDPSAVFLQLYEMIKQDAMRLGGTVMLEVGEGRTNVPVGTVLAMIEQQVQVMADVFKNNHRAQKEELHKLRDLFADNPQDLNLLVRERPRSPEAQVHLWQAAEEFTTLTLSPGSDPNLPSSIHRLMSSNVLAMLAQQMPQQFDIQAVLEDVLKAIRKNPEEFIAKPEQQAPPAPDPKLTIATIKAQTEQAKQQTDAVIETGKLQVQREHLGIEAAKSAAQNQTDLAVAHAKNTTDLAAPYHQAAANPTPAPMTNGALPIP
jgi:hypothetical protein